VNPDGSRTWVQVNTAPDGTNDLVWLTTFAQCLLLSPNESPFYAQYGIPAQRSVMSQIFPDFYMSLMQQLFAPRFASLSVAKLPSASPKYTVNVVTHQGVKLPMVIAQ
jgi:hypothetical protein